jgi:hypothetical protein
MQVERPSEMSVHMHRARWRHITNITVFNVTDMENKNFSYEFLLQVLPKNKYPDETFANLLAVLQ